MRINGSLRRQRRIAPLGVAALLAALLLAQASSLARDLTLHVDETRLIALDADGTALPPETLRGMQLSLGDPSAGGYVVRINDMRPDPYTPDGTLVLYDVSFRNPATERWEPLCTPGPHGLALAVPVAGTWSATGRYRALPARQFTFACTSGAHVKCLRFGYRPWATTPEGESLAPYHQACTRMIRADYCGQGKPHTVAGKTVQVFDRAGLHARPMQPYGRFEAVWGSAGAVCLRRPRVPTQFPLERILQACPELAARVGEQCTEAVLWHHPQALLANRS